ncbi:hypothetical protein FKM82_020112 [Ascaphus truei]
MCLSPQCASPGKDLEWRTTCPACGASYFTPCVPSSTSCLPGDLVDSDIGSDDAEFSVCTAEAGSVSKTVPPPEPIHERATEHTATSRMCCSSALMMSPPLTSGGTLVLKDEDFAGDPRR